MTQKEQILKLSVQVEKLSTQAESDHKTIDILLDAVTILLAKHNDDLGGKCKFIPMVTRTTKNK